MTPEAGKRTRLKPSDLKDARTLRTRQSLRLALLGLLEHKQLEHITVRDIAARAGIGYATFFRHHASKQDLLDEIAAEQIGRLMELTFPLLDAADTRVACEALCRYVDQHRVLWTALLTGGAAGALREEFIRLAEAEGAVRHEARASDWLPVDLGAIYGVTATVEILAWWLRKPAQYSAEQVAEIIDRLVVTPSLGPSAPARDSTRKRRSRKSPSAARNESDFLFHGNKKSP
jgi:AcrR family transcriptional regulator